MLLLTRKPIVAIRSTVGASTSEGASSRLMLSTKTTAEAAIQEHCIGESADGLHPVEAVGVGVVRRTDREARRTQPDNQGDDVDEHVGRITQQREAAGHETTADLERQHADREEQGDQESSAGRRAADDQGMLGRRHLFVHRTWHQTDSGRGTRRIASPSGAKRAGSLGAARR